MLPTLSSGHLSEILKPIRYQLTGRVCGSDFVTYRTRAHFLEMKMRKPELEVVHLGPCKKTCSLYMPVCALIAGCKTKTYDNRCHLDYAQKHTSKIQVLYQGRCETHRDMERLLKKHHPCGEQDLFGSDYLDSDVETFNSPIDREIGETLKCNLTRFPKLWDFQESQIDVAL